MLNKLLKNLLVQGMISAGLKKYLVLCPVCNGSTREIGSVDFNRSCEDKGKRVFEKSSKLVKYRLCDVCFHCFAPEFWKWSDQRFLDEIYNDKYMQADPELLDIRPAEMVQRLENIFASIKQKINHLDYGGGLGTLSQLLCEHGWNSSSYDPFFPGQGIGQTSEQYDLVTAIEVFEHVPHPHQLIQRLLEKMKDDGVLFFSTLLSDQALQQGILLQWWYLAPRNGHVSLFSYQSLSILLEKYDLKMKQISPNDFIAYRKLPEWCEDIPALLT